MERLFSAPLKSSTCLKALKAVDDLTLIPEVGHATRDAMATEIPTVASPAGIKPETYIIRGKNNKFAGVGIDRLRKFQEHAQLLHSTDPKPYVNKTIRLPVHELELSFRYRSRSDA